MTQAAILAANASIMTAPSGTAPGYQCRAWVNFNGTGTVAIRGSGNVSSITDNGTGLYRVNFTTAMPDVNYATTCTGGSTTGYFGRIAEDRAASTSSYASLVFFNFAGADSDPAYANVAIFR